MVTEQTLTTTAYGVVSLHFAEYATGPDILHRSTQKVGQVDVSFTVGRIPAKKKAPRRAIMLVGVDKCPGERIATLTVNIPEAEIADDEIIVKTWSENEGIAKDALASGLFEDTGRRIPTGFVEAQVWRVR